VTMDGVWTTRADVMEIMTVAILILATNAAAVRSLLLKPRGKHDGAEETRRRRGRVVFTFPLGSCGIRKYFECFGSRQK